MPPDRVAPRSQRRVWRLKALVLLPLIDVALRTIGFRRTYRAVQWFAPGDIRDGGTGVADLVRAEQCARVVYALANRWPYPMTCLRISLALTALLQREQIRSDLRLGVRKEPQFEAHAWVEVDGEPLYDEGGDSYTPYPTLQVD